MINDVIASETTWSFSRLAAFDKCPYQWYRKYVLGETGGDLFFSGYGTLCHDVIAKVYRGECSDPLSEFLIRYPSEVPKDVSNKELTGKYLSGAIDYFSHMKKLPGKVLDVEKRMFFNIGKYRFVGVADLILQDSYGQIWIVDHKSKSLNPRNPRRKKDAAELDQYLRQLYLYALPVREEYGRFPMYLCFNCFRTGTFVQEPFDFTKIKDTQSWALDAIARICAAQDYPPNLEWFSCRNLCELHGDCEYYDMIDT